MDEPLKDWCLGGRGLIDDVTFASRVGNNNTTNTYLYNLDEMIPKVCELN